MIMESRKKIREWMTQAEAMTHNGTERYHQVDAGEAGRVDSPVLTEDPSGGASAVAPHPPSPS